MGLLDSLLQSDLVGDLSKLASENPQIVQAATSLLTPGEGTVGPAGGLPDVIDALRSSGLGDAVSSWLGQGANQSIGADQIRDALGSDVLGQFASKAGIGADQAGSLLAGMLPGLIDQLSPGGQAPDVGSLSGMLGGLFD